MAMGLEYLQQLHFVFIPFMAPGHTIPMINIARMVAERGIKVTIFSTATDAKRFESVIAPAIEAGFGMHVIQLQFQLPLQEVGLPQSCDSVDMLPSMDMVSKFVEATSLLQPSIEQFLKVLEPSPACIVSDMCMPWTAHLAEKFDLPRILFQGFGCFSLLCLHHFRTSSEGFEDSESEETEIVAVPNLPDKIELTKAQVTVSGLVKPTADGWKQIYDQMMETEENAFGVVVNTFEELESTYIKEYGKALNGKRIWCVGPVSLTNTQNLDDKTAVAESGNENDDEYNYNYVQKWLDSKEPNSVIYVCMGSLTRSGTSQMIELGLGLELSNRPFIWVVRETSEEFKKWILEETYEERVKGKGMLIKGWAPQVRILSHPSVGGFLTHCGWNSTLEGICLGVPLLTWPAFAEQFINEELVVNILKTGIKVGVKKSVYFGHEEEVGVLVKREDVRMGIQELMDGEAIRKRAKELSNLARTAMDEGGSSHANLTKLIQDVMEEANLENHHSSSVHLIT